MSSSDHCQITQPNGYTVNNRERMNMNETTGTCAVAPPVAPPAAPALPQKHLEIHHAISDMSSVVESLDNLLIRVRGPVPQAPEKEASCVAPAPPANPTLSGVLSGSPSLIREKIERAHRLIDELNQELF
jgi:hypothetical protein